eukprot:4567827-Karenia_brevis.AAC.1
MRQALTEVLGTSNLVEASIKMEAMISMPHVLGGLGLRSATRTATAAYWASIADALLEIRLHNPTVAEDMLRSLQGVRPASSSIQEASSCREMLLTRNYTACPTWQQVYNGVRPAQVESAEPGEWQHGWQYCASI